MLSALISFKILWKIITLPCPVLFALEISMTIEGFSGISKFSQQFDWSLPHLAGLIANLPFMLLAGSEAGRPGELENLL